MPNRLIRLCLPIENLRGQSYDESSNMSGRYNGVQALICQEQPLTYYTHCIDHRVNLVAQYVSEPECIRYILTIVNEVGQLYTVVYNCIQLYTMLYNCPTSLTMVNIYLIHSGSLTYYDTLILSNLETLSHIVN